MGVSWDRDEYVLALSADELNIIDEHRATILRKGGKGIIGYNTGCSLLYPYKKFTVEKSIELIQQWRENFPDYAIGLLGGREDTERQRAMKAAFSHDDLVIDTPTSGGLRSGVLWMATSDVVFTGCSLGLHIGIALKKMMIAWFGVSCSQEIDLYDRGHKLVSEVSCTPCWKKGCSNQPKCYDKVDLSSIMSATQKLVTELAPK